MLIAWVLVTVRHRPSINLWEVCYLIGPMMASPSACSIRPTAIPSHGIEAVGSLASSNLAKLSCFLHFGCILVCRRKVMSHRETNRIGLLCVTRDIWLIGVDVSM